MAEFYCTKTVPAGRHDSEQTTYEKEYVGLVETGTFAWTDKNGELYKNQIEIHSLDYLEAIDSIYRRISYELTCSGEVLQQLELLIVTINRANTTDAQIFTTNDVGI